MPWRIFETNLNNPAIHKVGRPKVFFVLKVSADGVGDEPFFDFEAGPGGFAKESEAGLDAWIEEEAADWNAPGHLFPAVLVDQIRHDGFERDAMQWVVRMGCGRGHDTADRCAGKGQRVFRVGGWRA